MALSKNLEDKELLNLDKKFDVRKTRNMYAS